MSGPFAHEVNLATDFSEKDSIIGHYLVDNYKICDISKIILSGKQIGLISGFLQTAECPILSAIGHNLFYRVSHINFKLLLSL